MHKTIVCVGTVVRRADEILLVRQGAGHPLEGQWTIPWGRVDQGESPTAAALRETKEESGITGEIEGLLGIQELPEPWVGMIGILFLCRHVGGGPRPDNRETDAAAYFDRKAFEELSATREALSHWLLDRVFDSNYVSLKPDTSNPFSPSAGYL